MTIDEQLELLRRQIRQHRENGKHAKANKLAEQLVRTISNRLRKA